MDKKILAFLFCLALLIPQDSLGQHARTLSLTPETKTALLEAPKPKPAHTTRNVFIANTIMFGASVVDANAESYGSHQCLAELRKVNATWEYGRTNYGGGQLHPYQRDFKITIPLDIGVTALSLLMHKKHHDTLAVLFPVSSASAQISAAGLKYGAGCF